MAASGSTFRQDLPPKGGYEPINWTRIPSKSYLTGGKLFFGVAVMHLVGLYWYRITKRMIKHENLENNDAKMAIEPLLWAERDREFLKQIRRNHEEEEKLMKNVPGWQPGTLYGEPIYKTFDKKDWVDPIIEEYYAHAHPKYIWENFSLHRSQ